MYTTTTAYSNCCLRCQQTISPDRLRQLPTICDNCGHLQASSETRSHENLERSLLTSAIVASVLLVSAFMFLGNWGSHSLEIIPLQAGELLHINSSSDDERLAQIGLDLKKYDMVEKEYTYLAQQTPANWARLAKFQMSRKEFQEAADNYKRYFAASGGNRDLDARFDYAKALAEIGKIDDAAKNFEYVLGSRPGIRQVTVIEHYVTMLVKAERFDQAQRVIEHVRHQDPSASRFMDTEYKVISEKKRSRG
jgi:tetratricopeptide (TPR) repeat protein